MLVLTRFEDQWIVIGQGTPQEVRVQVVDVRGDRVKLGFVADRSVVIDRAEVAERKEVRG